LKKTGRAGLPGNQVNIEKLPGITKTGPVHFPAIEEHPVSKLLEQVPDFLE
jgi:hypothetical protein